MNELFGTLSDGTPVRRWTVERAGVRARILSSIARTSPGPGSGAGPGLLVGAVSRLRR